MIKNKVVLTRIVVAAAAVAVTVVVAP